MLVNVVHIAIVFALVSSIVAVEVTLQDGARLKVDKKVEVTEPVNLQCGFSATERNGDAEVDWMYHPTLEAAEVKIVRSGIVGDKYKSRFSINPPASLQIQKTETSDAGFYECNVYIDNDTPNTGKGTYNLTILVPPSTPVCQYTSDNKITLGFREEFRCRSSQGIPSPTYTWYKDDQPLPTDGKADTRYHNTSYSYDHRTGTLVFARVVALDAGTYHCEARNEVAADVCRSAEVSTKQQDILPLIGIGIGCLCGIILICVVIYLLYRKGYCISCCGVPGAKKKPRNFNDVGMDSHYGGSKGGRAASEFSGYSAGRKTDVTDYDGHGGRTLEDQREYTKYSRERLDDQASEYKGRRLEDQGEYSRYSRERIVDAPSEYSSHSKQPRPRDDDEYNRGRRLDEQKEYSRYSRERLDDPSDYDRNRRLEDQREYSRYSRERLDDPSDYRDRRLEDQREYSRYSRERLDDDYNSQPRDNRSDYNSYPRENRSHQPTDYRRHSLERQLDNRQGDRADEYNNGRYSQAPSEQRSGPNERFVPEGAIRVMP